MAVGATGTGKAGLFLDAANGDFTGADYFYIQNNDDGNTTMGLGGGDLGIMNGNVGIGTTSPSNMHAFAGPIVEISGTEPVFVLNDTTASAVSYQFGVDNNLLMISDNVAHRIVIKDGNVGIGTTSPGERLDINGAMHLMPQASPPATANSGDLYVDSTPSPDELCFYDGASWQGISSGTDANCA